MTDNVKMNRLERAEYWKDRVVEWEKSGQKVSDFCRNQNLKASSLNYWKSKFTPGKDGFVRIPKKKINANLQMANGYEVIISGGIRIRVQDGFNPKTLVELVRTMREAG